MEYAYVYAILFVLVEFIHRGIDCFPLNRNGVRRPVIPTSEQITFMQNYGYLDGGQTEFAAQYTEETIIEALMNIQRFGAIEQTGILDENTINLMKKRRCGVKDIIKTNDRRKRYTIYGTGWMKRTIKYAVLNWTEQLGEEAVKSVIKKALDVWAVPGRLTIVLTNDSDADIRISFHSGHHGDKFPFDGLGNVLAHAFFPHTNNAGNIHFDNDEYWSINGTYDDDETETTSFFPAVVHELGHSLGIGHSDVPEAIMFPYYTETNTKMLDMDDIQAIQKLYITMLNDSSILEAMSTTEKIIDTTPTTMIDHTSLPTTSYTRNNINDLCHGYDTIAVLRNELYVFKDENIWIYETRGSLKEGYPVNINRIFPSLPISLNKIDAAFEMNNGSIVFFSGTERWIYTDDISVPFDNHQFPNTSIDAVMLWSLNNKIYVFKGDQFWRYDEMNVLDSGYPKNISRWKGVPSDVDAAIQLTDGSTYFFKGFLYWRFNNVLIQTDSRYPLPTPQVWFGCPESNMVFQNFPK